MNCYVKEVYSLLLDGNKEWADLNGESDKPAEVRILMSLLSKLNRPTIWLTVYSLHVQLYIVHCKLIQYALVFDALLSKAITFTLKKHSHKCTMHLDIPCACVECI